MNLHQKTQKLAKKLEAMADQGLDVSLELAEHLEVLDRALDQILGLVDMALQPPEESTLKQEPFQPDSNDFLVLDEKLVPTNLTSLAPSSNIPVLLVEDNLVNRKLAVLILEKIGCNVVVAINGAEGVEKFKTGEFNAIFMDCQMPVMDGYEATRAIRDLEAGASRIPIIAVTANALKGDKEKCLDCGMDDYITKPLRPSDLQEAVNRWCGAYA